MLARLVVDAWIGLAVLAVLVGIWLVRIGESTILVWVVMSGLHLVLLPAWGALAVGVIARRWTLVAAASVIVLVQIGLTWQMLPWRGAPEGLAPEFTIGSLNVYAGNADVDAMAAQVMADPPDVLVLQEFTPDALEALERAGVDEVYPHRIVEPDAGTVGVGVFATQPLEAADVGIEDVFVVDLTLPDGDTLRLFDVHAFPPGGAESGSWRATLRGLDAALDRAEEPWVAIGDYNATFDHRAYRDLLGDGRTDAHLATGRGLARTWPADMAVPPLFLIDHAVLSPDVTAVGTRERTVAGSDHRMIEVDIAR